MKSSKWTLLNYACGFAGKDLGAEKGPEAILAQPEFAQIADKLSLPEWFRSENKTRGLEALEPLTLVIRELALRTQALAKSKQRFVTLAGDHTCALGTWAGASSAKHPLGLIWVDAHMDSHTIETTPSSNIHGMPLAALLGHGSPKLTQLIPEQKSIAPEHLCLIGIRSYENEEHALLERLGVRIYYMDEVEERGLDATMTEAIKHVNQGTKKFGISIDLDSIDPSEAPGVSVPEDNGLHADELLESLHQLHGDERLAGIEIAEYNPTLDTDNCTAQIAIQLLQRLLW